MKAFQDGASIQVQPVSTVEEIRITDLDMQKRWTTTTENEEEENFPHGANVINEVCMYVYMEMSYFLLLTQG